MDTNDRKELGLRNYEWGEEAERIAEEYFLKEGYTVRERRWKMNKLEVDLILEKDRTLVFVEVKARARGSHDPADSVDRRKRLSIIRAADVYLQMQQFLYAYRFDIVTLTGNRESYEFQHYADAYLPPVNGGRR